MTKQQRITDILFQRNELVRIKKRKFNELDGAVFYNKNNIGIRKVTVLKQKNRNDFNLDLSKSKLAKFIAKEIMNKLAFVISRWFEDYIDDDGEVRQMVLRGYPMEALNECLRGFTLLFLALPEWYGVTEEERVPLTEMVNELLARSEDKLDKSYKYGGSKSNIISKVGLLTATKDDKKFLDEMNMVFFLIAHDVVMDIARYCKCFEIILRESEENKYFEEAYNASSKAMMTYLEYIDHNVLFVDRYNKILYGA